MRRQDTTRRSSFAHSVCCNDTTRLRRAALHQRPLCEHPSHHPSQSVRAASAPRRSQSLLPRPACSLLPRQANVLAAIDASPTAPTPLVTSPLHQSSCLRRLSDRRHWASASPPPPPLQADHLHEILRPLAIVAPGAHPHPRRASHTHCQDQPDSGTTTGAYPAIPRPAYLSVACCGSITFALVLHRSPGPLTIDSQRPLPRRCKPALLTEHDSLHPRGRCNCLGCSKG
jgi:hypothetical protein